MRNIKILQLVLTLGATLAPLGLAQQASPYKVLKAAKVGGEGGWDYIYADVADRRLFIPRGAVRAAAAVAAFTTDRPTAVLSNTS